MFCSVGDVVQFNENHKWCGCLGIIEEVRGNYDKYMIGVPIPEQGTAYIFIDRNDDVIEYVGKAVLMQERKEKIKE